MLKSDEQGQTNYIVLDVRVQTLTNCSDLPKKRDNYGMMMAKKFDMNLQLLLCNYCTVSSERQMDIVLHIPKAMTSTLKSLPLGFTIP